MSGASHGTVFGVINNDLLQEAIKGQAPKCVKDYAEESGANDSDVKSLRLDFHSILSIDNLITFTSLTKLQLDNNLIERIANLESLVNLTWLDLSYNNIDTIEGLETLVNLTDLSLQHNQISRIEGLDMLKKLDVLSLGDNQLETLEDSPVLYLRKFKTLRSLSLTGNQLCADANYEAYLLAYVPQLLYLDWRRITDQNRDAANTHYFNQLETLKHKEEEATKTASAEAAVRDKIEEYRASGVPEMFGDAFYTQLYDHPAELGLLHVIPAVQEGCDNFKELVMEISEEIGTQGLVLAVERATERAEVQEGIAAMSEQTAATGSEIVDAYMVVKNQKISDAQSTGGAVGANILESLSDLVEEKRQYLMNAELDLNSRILETLSTFDRNSRELLEKSMGVNSEQMSKLREAEEQFTILMTGAVSSFFDQYSHGSNEDNIEVNDELHMLMRDKESVVNVVVNMHDKHMASLDAKEDELTNIPLRELETFADGLKEAEKSRNREAIGESRAFHNFQFDDIEHVEMP